MGTISEENNIKISRETIQSYLDRKFQGRETIVIYRHLNNVTVIPYFNDDKTHRYGLIIEKGQQTEFSKKIFDFSTSAEKLNDFEKEIKNTVCVILFNPSYADEYIADKTTSILEDDILNKKKIGKSAIRIIIVNKFSEICTANFNQAAPLETWKCKKNMVYIKRAIELSGEVLIAWGKTESTKIDNYIYKCLLAKPNKKYFIANRHPSRGEKTYSKFLYKTINKLLQRV